MTAAADHPRVTPDTLRAMKQAGAKISCLTAYDASFASLLENAGVEVVLVGDSLGMVLQGHESTTAVTMDDMVYHAACVARAITRPLRVVDMPYRSYDSAAQALDNARRLLDAGGGHMVKLEGGSAIMEVVTHLTANGVPVCGHLGLLPQSVQEMGGYRVQGRDAAGARMIREDALALQAAGVQLLVLECVPESLGEQVTRSLDIPTIGIGAGAGCDGQVLVLHDMLGITTGKRPKFVKDFLAGHDSVAAAIQAFVTAVREARFPDAQHSYH